MPPRRFQTFKQLTPRIFLGVGEHVNQFLSVYFAPRLWKFGVLKLQLQSSRISSKLSIEWCSKCLQEDSKNSNNYPLEYFWGGGARKPILVCLVHATSVKFWRPEVTTTKLQNFIKTKYWMVLKMPPRRFQKFKQLTPRVFLGVGEHVNQFSSVYFAPRLWKFGVLKLQLQSSRISSKLSIEWFSKCLQEDFKHSNN